MLARPLRESAATRALVTLLLAGLALRLILAYVLFPGSGFASDVGTFRAWAGTMVEFGPGGFYANAGFADYPPGYLWVLWLVGHLTNALAPLTGGDVGAVLVKLPAILADLGVGALLFHLARGWSGAGRHATRAGLLAGGLFLFNPVTWYDSALWGQVDSVGAVVMLLGVAFLVRGRPEAAVVAAVVAGVIKPQFGVILGPIVVAVLLRRHLLAPAAPSSEPSDPGLRGWLAREQGPLRLVTSAIAGLVAFHILVMPFGLDVPGYVRLVAQTAGGYPYLTVNAYNPWALFGTDGTAPLAFSDPGLWSDDTVPFLGPIPAVLVGSLLLAVGFAVGVGRLLWRADRRSILLVAVFLTLCFFILPTRVHERYGFPAFAFLPLLAVADRRWFAATALLSIGTFINLHGVLTTESYGTENITSLPLGDLFRAASAIVVSIALHVGVFVFTAWQLRPAVAGPVIEAGRDADEAAWTDALPSHAAGVSARSAVAPVVPSSAAVGDGTDLPGAPADAGPEERWPPGWGDPIGWVRDRLRVAPVRRDRSGELAREGGGRLDRLDLLMVVLVLLSTLTLRTWRLAEPYDMHFDEVYHARTATEFLQHWRYGMPDDIYEYTHPHLAKYAMAGGLVLFGNDRVTDESDLGVPVVDAAVEPRWSPDGAPGVRHGDRLYVATGSEVRLFDLRTRDDTGALATPAAALAIDETDHTLYLAGADGTLRALPTATVEATSGGDGTDPLTSMRVVGPLDDDLPPRAIAARGGIVLVAGRDGSLTAFEGATGERTGSTTVEGVGDIEFVPAADRVVAEPALIDDPVAAAEVLATALDDEAARIEELLASGAATVTVDSYLTEAATTAVQEAIDDGTLTGVTIVSGTAVAVAGTAGVTFLDAASLEELTVVGLEGEPGGMALVENLDDQTLYVAVDASLTTVVLRDEGPPTRGVTVPMPGTVTDALWNGATNLVHVEGRTSDDTSATIYVVEPHTNAVFADARLPFTPQATLLDIQTQRPSDDRQDILTLDAGGRVAAVDVGSHAFAWRLPGVIAGAATAVLLYLLARLLFRRRSVAVITAALALVEGMFFANSRIAMNDTYVTLFIVAAVTLFVPLYLGRWRGRLAVGLGLAAVGVLLGLALASKWVAMYAIGALLLLVLLRSALGRLVALAGMVVLTGVLGYAGLRANPDVAEPRLNLLFLLIMVGLTVLLAIATVVRPVRFSVEELRFAVAGPALLGAAVAGIAIVARTQLPAEGLLSSTRLLQAGTAALLLGAAAYAATWLAARFGMGPLAPPDRTRASATASPAPEGWLRPGWAAGVPWLYALAALAIVPVVVYLVSYIPWVALGNRWTETFPAGNTGQTFLELTKSMYEYHDNLRASHAASSPWWAWPFDLKPVWFYQDSFANSTTAVIYDAGNIVIFWLAIPAVAFAAWQAWRRRSLPLTVVVIAIAALWLPWSRIDRATFQYHVFTSLPFTVLALSYFLAELWHGPSPRTWLLARVAAAVAIVGAPLLWILRLPLCGLAGTEIVHPDGVACGPISRQVSVSESVVASLVVLALGALAIAWQLRALSARSGRPHIVTLPGGSTLALSAMAGIVATLVGTATLIALVQLTFSRTAAVTLQIRAEEVAIVAFGILAVPAWLVVQARDSRRFAAGAVGVAALWFVAWYPNISGLPLPSAVASAYLGFLSTYNYDFQFAVNLDEPYTGPLFDTTVLVVVVLVGLVALAAMYAARTWIATGRGGSDAPDAVYDAG